MIRLLSSTAARRLLQDRSFALSTLLSLSVAAVMCALTSAWMWSQFTVQIPYRSIESLWFIQVISSSSQADDLGSEMQSSVVALDRFVNRQDLFEDVLLAKSESAVVYLNNDDTRLDGTRIRALVHKPNLYTVLGIDLVAGVRPRADHQEVAVTHEFALRNFGAIDDALNKSIRTNKNPYTITGVLSENFVAPSLLGPQRNQYGAIDLYRPTARLFDADTERMRDRAERWLVVGRSEKNGKLIERQLEALLSEIAAEMGRWNLDVDVRPLRVHMLGNAPATGTVLLAAALVLAASTIFGVMLLAAARFAKRSSNIYALISSGATPAGEWAFERYEALLIAGLSGILALVLMFAVLPLLDLTIVAGGVVDSKFVLHGILATLAWTALLAGILTLVASTVAPAENPWMRRLQTLVGLSKKGSHGPLQMILQGIQVLVALASVTLLLMMLDTARSTLAASASVDYSGIVQWELEYPAGTSADMMRGDLELLRSNARSHPSVNTATISLASALDLLSDYPVSYSGPRLTGTETVRDVKADGSFILESRREDNAQAESSMLRYTLIVAPVEPDFFTLLDYQPTQGRIFEQSETDVTVLTPAASRALFDTPASVVDELVPALPRIERSQDSEKMWHGGIRAIGVVEDRRIHHALAGLQPLVQSPVAFVPYIGPNINPDSTVSSRGYLLLSLLPDKEAPNRLLEDHLQDSLVPGLRASATVLEDEKNKRLRQHLVGSLGILLIGILVISSAALSAWGSGRLSAHGRRQEIAVRLALGADESRLIRRVLTKELTGPVLLGVLWLCFVTVVETFGRILGLSGLVEIIDGIIAIGIVLTAVALGALFGVREPVLKPPMEVLRAE
ncbi:MAG: ABC transporter permease [Wenzhouxiangellaceae bacterium]